MRLPLSSYWRLLGRYLAPQRGRFILLAALLLADIGLQLLNPQIVRGFIDTALSGGSPEKLLTAASQFIAIALLIQALSAAAVYVGESVAWKATNALRRDLLEHTLRLDLSFHKDHTPGEMIERVDADVQTLSTFFSRFTIVVAANALLMAGVLVALYRESLLAGVALTIFASLALVAANKVRGLASPHWAAERQAAADLYGFVEERLVGKEDIVANGAVPFVLGQLIRLMRVFYRRSLKAYVLLVVLLSTTIGLFAIGNAVAFGVGAYLINTGAITIGTVYLIFHYTRLLRRPLEGITDELGELGQAGAAIDRVETLLETPAALLVEADLVWDGGDISASRAEPAEVAFHDISFRYEDGEWDRDQLQSGLTHDHGRPFGPGWVLQDISFTLAPGRVLGVIGRSGSGKTSLARLVARLYDPSAGQILVNGLDLRHWPTTSLRRAIGVVTQDVQIFQATVRENLSLFDPDKTDRQIISALEELGLGGWLSKLHRGLDTELGAAAVSSAISPDGLEEPNRVGASGGEAQLLAFGRVFLRDPRLVILDEASSRLDPITERSIEKAVGLLLAGRTAIIIAHRLETLDAVDEILILDKGRVLEYGSRAELATDPSSQFHRLLNAGLEEALG